MTTTPTFSERTTAVVAMVKWIALISHDLRLISEKLGAEAERMQAAQARFGKGPARAQKKAS
jgi:hypothetical protein